MKLYKKIIRPIFFKIDPEIIHNWILFFLGAVSRCWLARCFFEKFLYKKNNQSNFELGGKKLGNIIGLAAGFDKNIIAPRAYKMMGFGFVEFGSVTYEPQTGNPKPRLWRLPKDKSLIVNYGLSNCGAVKIRERLRKIPNSVRPFGINIAPSNSVSFENMADDYLKTFSLLQEYADYVALNISCPNVAKYDCFAQVSFVENLLKKIRSLCQKNNINKDIFLKIGPDLSDEDIDKVTDLCLKYEITGIIATNLIKNKQHLVGMKSSRDELNHPGGISGAPLKERSNAVISRVRQQAGDKLKIIGVGGIFTVEDVREKIACGADAIQMMTGWIYEGPLSVRSLNIK